MSNFDAFFSRDARAFRPSAIRAFAKLVNDPSIISFAGGSPNPDTFPAGRIAEIAGQVVRERRTVALQYGPTRGLPRLCAFIADLCSARFGAGTAPDQPARTPALPGAAGSAAVPAAGQAASRRLSAGDVLTTTGSQQALDLIAHTLLDPGDVVAVELPTYIGGSSSFFARSAELVGVRQDDEGIVPESLREVAAKRRIKLLYTIPNFQNPSGRLMTQARRAEVLAIAEERDFLVIEDDPYGELVYVGGADTTPMKSRDAHERVLYLGSFSKVLAPGLRCGWIIAAQPLLERLEIAKQAADLCSGMLDQSIVDEYCAAGELAPQIERVRAFYRGKRGVLLEELERHFAGRAEWTPADGGLFTFVTLHDDVDTAAKVQAAVAGGVAYIPGGPFFVDGSGRNTMRLTFAKESDERMREGMARLAGVFYP